MTGKPTRPRGRPPATEAKGRETLVDAAARVFSEQGYKGATVDAILAEAGLSKGAFYHHFRTKDDLVLAVLAERVERPIQDLIERLQAADPEDNMSSTATDSFAALLDAGRDAILLEHEYEALAARDPKLRKRYARRRRQLRDALAEALAARARRLGAPADLGTPAEEVATAYLALMRGLTRERLLDPDAVPSHILGEMTGLIYIGLLARAAPGDWREHAVLT